jgi:hypothetical protein
MTQEELDYYYTHYPEEMAQWEAQQMQAQQPEQQTPEQPANLGRWGLGGAGAIGGLHLARKSQLAKDFAQPMMADIAARKSARSAGKMIPKFTPKGRSGLLSVLGLLGGSALLGRHMGLLGADAAGYPETPGVTKMSSLARFALSK